MLTSNLTDLFNAAIDAKASDVHLNNTPDGGVIRFRQFGQLTDFGLLSPQGMDHLSNLIKLHAHLDVSATGIPQDGHLKWTHGNQTVDIRLSSLPTRYGEDLVCRFFEDRSQVNDLSELGFSSLTKDRIATMLAQKSGLILVTGATGSGKTTTLYTCLRHILATRFCNIITLEDPIEATLENIRQSQVNPSIGYDFVDGLRAILRQDPDVIMVGEIRDAQTAKTALEAAYTGHLVLSTLHTPNCASSLLRLASFNLDPFWVHHCLKGIISQTLIKRNDLTGRLALTELLEPDPSTPPQDRLNPKNAQFYISFEEDLAWKVKAGWVSPQESYA